MNFYNAMIALLISFGKHPLAYAAVLTVLCLPLMLRFFRAPKKHPLGVVILAVALALLWYVPVEGMLGRYAVRQYNQALPQPREIAAIGSQFDVFYGGTVISVSYADDPGHVYNYVYTGLIGSISADDGVYWVTSAKEGGIYD